MNLKLKSADVRFILFILVILLLTFSKSFSANRTASVSGNWSSTATWGGSSVPVAGDAVTINTGITVTVDGTYTCASITMNSNSNTLNVSSGNLTCTGNLSMLYNSNTASRLNKITISTGTFTVGGQISVDGTGSGSLTISSTGNFIFSNATTLTTNLTLTATLGTVTYNAAGNQGIRTTTYNNLVLGGSGTKSLAGNTTVNNDLTINSGVTLSQNSRRLSLFGNLVNNGTHTISSGEVRIEGTQDQSITGFTTTGTVSMRKTAGTATFTGNVSGGAFTLDGIGGTLDLGAGLTHTFTGTFRTTNGTLNGGSSTLNISGTTAVTGGSFTASTSTVNFSAAGSQTIYPLNYYNLSISTSGTKTITAATTVEVHRA
jgi:hypothetical protein